MTKSCFSVVAGFGALLIGLPSAQADTLEVGPGRTHATPCAAVAAAQPNDLISIAAGTYTDSCVIDVAGLTLRGESGRPKVDLSGTDHPAQYKGIYVVTADDVVIENLELSGAHISNDNGANAAAIRVEAAGLTVRSCNIHDNQNGILGGTTGSLTIEHSELFNNGVGDGCNQGGCTHNLYVDDIDTLTFRGNWSHGVATDTPDKGHLLKSRAKANYILYNRLTGEDGFDSYEIDLPNGGLAVIVGNQIQKGSHAGNSTLLTWGEEGATHPDKRVFLINNTFVNDLGSGKFLNVAGATLVAHNNLFAGAGDVGSASAVSADNWAGDDPLFVDRAGLDHHLLAGSPVIDQGIEVGMVDAISLTAVSEYVHPCSERARASTHDLGAFEQGSAPDAGAADGGASSSPDASVVGVQDASAELGRDAGDVGSTEGPDASVANPAADGGSPTTSGADGCSCSVPGAPADDPGRRAPWSFGCLGVACWLAKRRRRRETIHGLACAGLVAAGLWLAGCSSKAAQTGGADAGPIGASGHGGASGAGGAGQAGTNATSGSDAGPDATATGATDAATSPDASRVVDFDACPDLGWCELADTKLSAVCPDAAQYAAIQGYEGCAAVINDWSGGIADTKRNRLVLWGGGHHGYFGNELYALDLEALQMRRLNDPSDVTGLDEGECTPPEAYADGRPSSRHTYDGLAYVPHSDQLYAFAGSGVPCGYALSATWTLDLASVESAPSGDTAPWHDEKPSPYPTKAGFGLVSDYDPNTKKVVLNDGYSLWAYDVGSHEYQLLNDSDQTGAHIDYHMTGRVDPKRKLFVVMGGGAADGGGLQVFDIAAGSDHAQQDWTDRVSGCDALLAASSPGLAYDTKQGRLIGWAGGDDVYALDPDAKTCTKITHPGGPGAQLENGTFGRFRYFAALGVFAVVNSHAENAYVLRLTK